MMTQSYIQFKIAQLRQEKTNLALEFIGGLFFATFVSLFLPQLLFRYIYANQRLTEEPQLLQYIPVVAFVIGTLYFLYTVAMLLANGAKIKKLEKELMTLSLMSDTCCTNCAGGCSCDEHGNCNCGACEMPASMGETKKTMTKKKIVAKK